MVQALETQRKRIATRVRELRRARRWTQAELARQLKLSQSRLSELESGEGSFSAEQLLRVLALFNVGVEDFVEQPNDPRQELQNALARFGAKHLVESDRVVPTERLSEVSNVIRDALLDGSPRLITAIAPVLVAHASELSLEPLFIELQRLGRERRLGWVIDNTVTALHKLANHRGESQWKKLLLHVGLALELSASIAFQAVDVKSSPRHWLDVLDLTIRTDATRDEVQRKSSRISKKWGIVTAIVVDDFVAALRASR
jgi:transcriptional regulator with XRE-family HTH domain